MIMYPTKFPNVGSFLVEFHSLLLEIKKQRKGGGGEAE
jgi:hypothetical protein